MASAASRAEARCGATAPITRAACSAALFSFLVARAACALAVAVALALACAGASTKDGRCEYAHAMGNSGGNLDDYWAAFRDDELYPRAQGGFKATFSTPRPSKAAIAQELNVKVVGGELHREKRGAWRWPGLAAARQHAWATLPPLHCGCGGPNS